MEKEETIAKILEAEAEVRAAWYNMRSDGWKATTTQEKVTRKALRDIRKALCEATETHTFKEATAAVGYTPDYLKRGPAKS